MKNNLNISFIQTDLIWENPTANLANLEETIASFYQDQTELIVLPEMFNAGFSMDYAEPMNFTTHKWMKQMAMQYNSHIMGSLAIKENGQKFNRLLTISPNGISTYYDKKHLFVLGDEHRTFTPGTSKIQIDIKDWRIQPLVCYDLRFPVWCRNPNAHLMIYVASWPQTRIAAWRNLLIARAIENQCYVLGVNRIGKDGNGLIYNGQSLLVDFEGQIKIDAQDNSGMFHFNLDDEKLKSFKDKFPFYVSADPFLL
jgi:omega-amidase